MLDERVRRHYERGGERARLWESALGELTRLRTWDIFRRFLPAHSRIADIGGGPGAHAVHLHGEGHDVVLLDPVPLHVAEAGTSAVMGDARALPFADEAFDAVLLLGPLYHLPQAEDRRRSLDEARRVLRPGGRLLSEVITRHAWIVDATAQGLLGEDGIWETFDINLSTGLSNTPDRVREGSFWAYFHHVDEVRPELEEAGFEVDEVLAVEGFARLLGDLAGQLAEPELLMRSIALTESDPSMLGVSPHVIAVSTKPAG